MKSSLSWALFMLGLILIKRSHNVRIRSTCTSRDLKKQQFSASRNPSEIKSCKQNIMETPETSPEHIWKQQHLKERIVKMKSWRQNYSYSRAPFFWISSPSNTVIDFRDDLWRSPSKASSCNRTLLVIFILKSTPRQWSFTSQVKF